MRFQVPQFIEVEDKIFGPFTLKQFIYMAGGAGLSFLVYSLLKSVLLSAIPIVIILAASAALAFYKINGKPFINVAEAAFRYYLSSKLYIWKKTDNVPDKDAEAKKEADLKSYASITVPKISGSKLKDLTWSLDIQESIYTKKNQK